MKMKTVFCVLVSIFISGCTTSNSERVARDVLRYEEARKAREDVLRQQQTPSSRSFVDELEAEHSNMNQQRKELEIQKRQLQIERLRLTNERKEFDDEKQQFFKGPVKSIDGINIEIVNRKDYTLYDVDSLEAISMIINTSEFDYAVVNLDGADPALIDIIRPYMIVLPENPAERLERKRNLLKQLDKLELDLAE